MFHERWVDEMERSTRKLARKYRIPIDYTETAARRHLSVLRHEGESIHAVAELPVDNVKNLVLLHGHKAADCGR